MSNDISKFPSVQGGGSLLLAWQVRDKNVLVVGGGEVAASRILSCLNADAHVTVVCPRSGLLPEVAARIGAHQVSYHDRVFLPADLNATDLVLVAVDDPAASSAIWSLCQARRIPANIADVPAECDFFFGSVHRDGPLQIMVSTNGRGPRLAAMVRRLLAAQLPREAGAAVEAAGRLRAKLRARAPRTEDGPKRMRWVSGVSEKYQWRGLAGLTDEDMDHLVAVFYPRAEVPEIDVLWAMRGRSGWEPEEVDVFDGSFGFSVGG